MSEEIESDKFKALLIDMFRGYPNWRYFGMVEQVIKSPPDITRLLTEGFLIKEQSIDRTYYVLGPNSLPLISVWKTEELTKSILILTLFIAGITILQFLLK